MKRIGEFIAPALRQVTSRSSFAWLAGSWPAIVGKRLAAHTRPSKITNGVLDIAVSDKAWCAELESIASEFRSRVNDAWGSVVVNEVRFSEDRTNRPRRLRECDNDHTPFIRARKPTARPDPLLSPHGVDDL